MVKGFSLVSSLLVALLLTTVILGLLSLSSLELRSNKSLKNRDIAEANAQLALSLAIGELQKYLGADQRVTARAAILEGGESIISNENWLGVWSASYEHGDKGWPLIGKREKGSSSDSPYSREGALQDLRHSLAVLQNGQWREEQHLTWLVSHSDDTINPDFELNMQDPEVIEILGKGTLGDGLSDEAYRQKRVLIQKVRTPKSGAYAWYISDNNQKASIVPRGERGVRSLEASAQSNPAYVKSGDGSLVYDTYVEEATKRADHIVSYGSASLSQNGNVDLRVALQADYHDFTTSSSGLFTDTLMSGLRYDMTPLLFSYKSEKTVNFQNDDNSLNFSSSYPIIPGKNHAVLGPSFGALRNWGQHMHTKLSVAETSFGNDAVRIRPATNWAFGISDGACADAGKWAESAAKIHPVMTDARWHYYFSHHKGRVRSHIIPRVCLWNPYNRDLEIPSLSVLMPNPFHATAHGIHFFPEDEHVNQLKANHSDEADHPFVKWVKKSGYVGGHVYKLKLNPFPETRYLAFVLEATTLKAGECHVFSPKVSNPSYLSSGIGIQKYESEDVSLNILSSDSPQGENHFFYDHSVDKDYTIQIPSDKDLTLDQIDEIDFSQIKDYQPELSGSSSGKVDSFPFVLKSGVAATLAELQTSLDYVTLQLINNAAGGAHSTKSFTMQGLYWGAANQTDQSFGSLQTFQENPLKDSADTHQIGAKLLWLDESFNEGNLAPYRHGTNSKKNSRWAKDHMAYNPCLIANWNVRAQLTTRSPASQCGEKFYLNSTGPWIHQYVPLSPQDANDMPFLNTDGSAFVKNPFGFSLAFSHSPNAILFDLPSEEYGVLSMASLRHAMLSQYSWNPSYVIGHSLRDLHAPADSTAHEVSVSDYSGSDVATSWDYLLGAAEGPLDHGAYTVSSDSQGLMQIGDLSVSRSVAEESRSSNDEIIAYDIAYEVNHYLWDRFFISSMPLAEDGNSFEWNPNESKDLWNDGYEFNTDGVSSRKLAVDELSSEGGADLGFWRNAEFLKNRAAFNVNSTSVNAWVAILSGSLGVKRPLKEGVGGAGELSFARYRRPEALGTSGNVDPDTEGAWGGARVLSSEEVRLLAESIVEEVRLRGPFVSIADFVNRRLTGDQDAASRMGVIDAAIKKAQLNSEFSQNEEYKSTTVNSGSDSASRDNNLSDFSESYRYEVGGDLVTSQPTSQAWGLPGFLTQSDILEPIAPSLTARGDSFTIRCYGESSANGGVKSRAWLEAVVERTPDYIEPHENKATEALQRLDYVSGEYVQGELSVINKTFGRRYVIKSFRWLGKDEI